MKSILSIKDDSGSFSLQVIFIIALLSIISAALINTVQQSRRVSLANNSKTADVSVGLALVTNLSSTRLCLNAVGSTQVLNLSALNPAAANTQSPKIQIRFDIRGIGALENSGFNSNLGAHINSIFLESVIQTSTNIYEGLLKYSLTDESGSSVRSSERTAGKLIFELDSQFKFVSCQLKKI